MKIRLWSDGQGTKGITFFCPGCRSRHAIPVARPPGDLRPAWYFNGDRELPIVSPSINIAPGETHPGCHTFIGSNGAKPGHIKFLGDCTHKLAGLELPLPDFPTLE